MKKTLLVAALVVSAGAYAQQQPGYSIVERGANYRVWQRTIAENGTNQVHQYTELASGLNYTNENGQFVESKEQIDILPDGTAAATRGAHKVYFPPDIYNGVLKVITPDNKILYSRPLGVSYDDGSNCVWIGTLKHSTGQLVSSNKVVYPDAFENFRGDLVCTYRRGGFESDLVFRERPPKPDVFGLAPETSTLQLFTEFFNTQDPQQIPSAEDETFGLQDHTLRFGKLTMTRGKAFEVGTRNAERGNGALVYKTWAHLQGRTFLVEEVPLDYVADDLITLPESTNQLSAISHKQSGKFASNNRLLPAIRNALPCTNQIQMASLDLNGQPGVVLDYIEVAGDYTNYSSFTFAANTTYYISSDFNVYYDTILQAGAVLKFAPWTELRLLAYDMYPIDCQTTAENPAILTSKDDNSVGEVISGTCVPDDFTICDPPGIDNCHLDIEAQGSCPVQLRHLRFYYGGV